MKKTALLFSLLLLLMSLTGCVMVQDALYDMGVNIDFNDYEEGVIAWKDEVIDKIEDTFVEGAEQVTQWSESAIVSANEMFNSLWSDERKQELEQEKQNQLSNPPNKMIPETDALSSSVSASIPANSEWQKAWDTIDKKKSLLENYLSSDPGYRFESFVEEYRTHSYTRAWTAALSSGEIIGELPSALIKIIEGNVQDLSALFSSDAKVANLVIEYLAGNEFAEKYKAQDIVDASSEIITIEDELHSHIEFSSVSNLKVYSVKGNRQLKLSDVVCITYDNYEDMYHKIMAIRNPKDGTVDLTHPSIISNMYIDAPSKLSDKVQEKLGKKIAEEHGSDSIEMRAELGTGKTVLKGIEIFNYLVEPVISGYGAYVEFKKYEAVLSQYEEELQYILDCSNSKNTDRIVTRIMDILTDTVAEGIVLSIEKEIFADTAVTTGEILLDITCIPLAVVNIEGAILQLAANTSKTFGKIWSVEDLYEEFQVAESTLLQSIRTFYFNPNNTTYYELKANHQYYSILVKSGTNSVSSILISDAEAGINKFKNWVNQVFSGNKSDLRLQQIEYAQKILSDDIQLLNFITMLIFGQ